MDKQTPKKLISCPRCGGNGFITRSTDNSIWAENCGNCNGTGLVEVTMTNYDRIKAMNIDEMSEFLMFWAMNFMMGKSPMVVRRWLESEVANNER